MAVRRIGDDAMTDILSRAGVFATEELQNSARGGLQLPGCTPRVCLATSGLQRVAQTGPAKVAEGCTSRASLGVAQARPAKVAKGITPCNLRQPGLRNPLQTWDCRAHAGRATRELYVSQG